MTPSGTDLPLDCLILGGGAAGLFALAALRAQHLRALVLESDSLGMGQTRCAQGIIHGGVKYSLRGLVGSDSRAIAEMPERWRRMAEGREQPSLAGAIVRSRHCWLWRSDGLAGRLGMLGAQLALRARPEEVTGDERPELLRTAPGRVLRLPEPIFDPGSVLDALAREHEGCIARYDTDSLEIHQESSRPIRIRASVRTHAGMESIALHARCVVLAAGTGNERLREKFGLAANRTQRRPLHQGLVRSPSLPWLDGHCVDGDSTRVTITSARDSQGRVVWHLGGRLAEEGVALDRDALVRRAAAELRAVLPHAPLDGAEFAAYRVDRAEPLEHGRRPDDARLLEEGRVLTLWPTKLALAPRAGAMALERVTAQVTGSGVGHARERSRARAAGEHIVAAEPPPKLEIDFPLPATAAPPWHDALQWTREP